MSERSIDVSLRASKIRGSELRTTEEEVDTVVDSSGTKETVHLWWSIVGGSCEFRTVRNQLGKRNELIDVSIEISAYEIKTS